MDAGGVAGEDAALAVACRLLGSVCERGGEVDRRDLHVRDACDAAQDVLNVLLRDLLCAIKGGAVEVHQVQSVRPPDDVHSGFREVEPRLQLLGVVQVALDRVAGEISLCSDEVESRGLANHASSAVASPRATCRGKLVIM